MFTSTPAKTAETQCKWWNSRFAGKIINGKPNGTLHLSVKIFCRSYLTHRIIWLICNGEWPEDNLDHRNGDGFFNKLENLREATQAQNCQNLKKYSNNKSGYTGVSWHAVTEKWAATIKNKGKQVHLGLFLDPKEASEAYLKARKKLYKFQPVPREN